MKRPKVQTQFIVFNLFGDYVNPRGDTAWTSGLLEVLQVLGVGERAARSTLSRMKQKGWLRASKNGRRSAYQLSPKGILLLEQGGRRLFGLRPTRWDSRWHLVIYSLPEELRAARSHLRTGLSWLGYGMLSPGTMIAAYPMGTEVQSLLHELEVEPYVHFFTGSQLEMAENREVVERCWDLPALNRRYTTFIRRHRQALAAVLLKKDRGGRLPQDECFELRFWATYEFSAFPREDPRLPQELLPSDWRGLEAADFMDELRAALKDPAEKYIDSTLGILTKRNHEQPEKVPA